MTQLRKPHIPKPENVWTEPIVHWLRVYMWISRRFVPMLFALLVAAPVGVLILPFFIPKFIRNAHRRRYYGVDFPTDKLTRISGRNQK